MTHPTHFRGHDPGDRIWYWIANGLSTHGRRIMQDFKAVRGKIVMVFPTHVVCNSGNEAMPNVVDDENYIGRKEPAQKTYSRPKGER